MRILSKVIFFQLEPLLHINSFFACIKYRKLSQEFLQDAKKSKIFFGKKHVFSWFFQNLIEISTLFLN